jgi:hypothetical protein
MTPVVRGKFTVVSTTNRSATSTYVEVELSALYSQSAEDNSYASATPSGSIKMTITNPLAVEKLPIGGQFYVDFTPVEK